jgi:hypothetical protein
MSTEAASYVVRCIMPNDRCVRIDNNAVVEADAEPTGGDSDNACGQPRSSRSHDSVKYRAANGELECMSCDSLAIRFSFEYTSRLVFLHERDLRDCLLQTVDGQTEPSREFTAMLRSGSCSSAISVRHVGVVDGMDVGHGVFSEESIPCGTYIGEYVGLVSSFEETTPQASHFNCQYPSLEAGLQINAREVLGGLGVLGDEGLSTYAIPAASCIL